MEPSPIERARERVLTAKEWGNIPAHNITNGDWDRGCLIMNALAEIEAEDRDKAD